MNELKKGFGFWAIGDDEARYMAGPISSCGGYIIMSPDFDFGGPPDPPNPANLSQSLCNLALVSDSLRIKGVRLRKNDALKSMEAHEGRLRASSTCDTDLDDAEEIRVYRLAAMGLHEEEGAIEARLASARRELERKQEEQRPRAGGAVPDEEVKIGEQYFAPYNRDMYACRVQADHLPSKNHPDGGWLVYFLPHYGEVIGRLGQQKIVPKGTLQQFTNPRIY